MDATMSSIGSGTEDASFLRAQLTALKAKVKVLEAKSAQPPQEPAPGSSPTPEEEVENEDVDEALECVEVAHEAD